MKTNRKERKKILTALSEKTKKQNMKHIGWVGEEVCKRCILSYVCKCIMQLLLI